MIDYSGETWMVAFEITTDNGGGGRTLVKIPLVDYLALTKAARTLEEFRALYLTWVDCNKRTKRALQTWESAKAAEAGAPAA